MQAALPELFDCLAVAAAYVQHRLDAVVRETRVIQQLVHQESSVAKAKVGVVAGAVQLIIKCLPDDPLTL